jgi:hypothetical protein
MASHCRDQCPSCGGEKDKRNKQCRKCYRTKGPDLATAPTQTIIEDREHRRDSRLVRHYRDKYEEALKTIDQREQELYALNELRERVETFVIEPKHGSGTSEGTPVVLASDWHVEEVVGAEVGDLNRHNIEIAESRATQFFQATLRLIRLLNQDIKIETVIIGLLGDFITNELHDAESAEKNGLQPTHAIVAAQNFLISGIEFLLNHSPYSYTFVCRVGNHGRTTKRNRFAAELGHSLEYLMYLHLAAYFRGESRVNFLVPESYHAYVDVYGKVIRFHHGHAIRYAGGIGGLFVPAYKAVSQWNKAKQADLDVFGHFHQSKDGGNFICNGSQIGYNGFAVSIKADFEPPKQTLFLMDKKRGRTCTWPILYKD